MTPPAILVVEDESITATDIQQSLRRSGYSVPEVAFTGKEAIDQARRCRPDLVVMDISLRGPMDGIEAATRIRSEFDIPVIFLTAYADGATLQRAKAAEPFAYLLKPFEEAVLTTTIDIALHKHRAHQLLVQHAAQELQLSQQRFKALSESISDYAIVLLDAAGTIVSWSPGAESLHGWAAAEVLGKSFSLLYPAADLQQHKPDRDLQTAVRAGRHIEFGSRVRNDQSTLAVESTVIALRNSGGELAGFLQLTRELSPAQQGN